MDTPPHACSAHTLICQRTQQLRARILEHHSGTLSGEDPEDLHRMRTSTRRLRANLRSCRGALRKRVRKQSERELAWLARQLGPVRDLDVMILELPRLLGAVECADAGALAALLAWLAHEREQARRPLLPALVSPRFHALIDQLERSTVPAARGRRGPLPASEVLAPRLLSDLQELYDGVVSITPDSPDEQLHQLRIHGKRLRYGCELALSVLPLRPFMATLKIPHGMLGEHQDASVASTWVERFAQLEPAHRPGCVAWQEALALERRRLRASFLQALPGLRASLGEPGGDTPAGLAGVLLGGR
jgi:CHAD domain-containing protein